MKSFKLSTFQYFQGLENSENTKYGEYLTTMLFELFEEGDNLQGKNNNLRANRNGLDPKIQYLYRMLAELHFYLY
jgi:hypothetical protein